MEIVAAADGDTERVRDAISVAASEELVELEDSRLRFAHPLLASICYERAPVWKRRAAHRALAFAVADLEERVRHRALAAEGPDATVAAELESAAERVAARGATAAAAELCELAGGLTADDSAAWRRRRVRAARYYRLAGDSERGASLLRELLPEVPSGVERADAVLELLYTLTGDRRTRMRMFDEALEEAAGDDLRAARILSFRVGFDLWHTDVVAALEDARRALGKAERVGDDRIVAGAIARVGLAETYACEITPGLLERGAQIEARQGLALEYDQSPRYSFARLLMRLGEIERARGMLEELEANAVARGDEHSRVMVLWPLSMLEWLAGRLARARQHARAAYELGEEIQHGHGRAWIGRVKALVEADLGMVEQARASLDEGLAYVRGTSEFATIAADGVLGRLELELGDVEAAASCLRELPGRLLAAGLNDPATPVWADAIETLIAVGELDRAGSYLTPFELHAKRLASPFALAGAARCRGLLAAAGGDLDSGLSTLERALSADERVPHPLERGRTLLSLGTLRRRALQKKAAREALETAAVIFDDLDARLWAEKARAELGRVSGRRPGGDQLTETERQVAVMAAGGSSNREIASVLFMGVSTVEAHLSHVYRKLGIRSRAGLGARLSSRVDAGAKPVDELAQS